MCTEEQITLFMQRDGLQRNEIMHAVMNLCIACGLHCNGGSEMWRLYEGQVKGLGWVCKALRESCSPISLCYVIYNSVRGRSNLW